MLTYAPYFISTVIVVSLIIQLCDVRSGLFNIVRGWFGLKAVNPLSDPGAFRWIYILSGIWQGTGYGAIIYLASLSGVDAALEEAAMIDGASKIKVVVSIVLPLAKQGIAVSAMYVFLNAWNEFTYALYLSLSTKTLPLQVYYYTQRGGFFQTAAYSTILAIPVIIVTFLLQQYLKSDYLSGAVKG